LSNTKNDAAHEKEIASLTTEVATQTAAYKEIEGQIRAESPRYASLMQPQPLTLLQVQQLITDDRTVLLQYFLGKERSYVWAVTRNALAAHALPPRDEIERRVRPYRDALAAPGEKETAKDATSEERSVGGLTVAKRGTEIDSIAPEVSRMLLAPVAQQLSHRRVAIVADGVLQSVPFAALLDPRSLQ